MAGKKFKAAAAQVADRPYTVEEAVPLIQKVKYTKFDETVELALRLGVDPKHADQMVRGTVVLPHGLGKTKRVLVIAGPDKQKEAQDAGADVVAGEEVVDKIQGGKVEFRVDKTGIVHAPIGKISFSSDRLIANAHALVDSVVKAKPAAAKGKYLKSVTMSSTMGPGVSIDTAVAEAAKH
jgi:large subunit ribosomal protein L1